MTGCDSRSAIQPIRQSPPISRIAPTMSASVLASPAYSGDFAAAMPARLRAKIGVMVESAPIDRKRLEPKAANASDPAMKAKKPSCGGKLPSCAVAICSGIAIAASISPATTS